MLGLQLASMILKIFSNLNDSMNSTRSGEVSCEVGQKIDGAKSG